MTTISLDLETRSLCDLRKTGGFRYAEDESTHILCYAYKIDDDPVQGVAGEIIPDTLREHIISGATIQAWNGAGFDIPVWNARFPDCPISLDQLDDPMDRARAAGLPASLDNAAKFMGLDILKDREGQRLMLVLCNGENPEPTEAELQRLMAYCVIDVKVENKLSNLIPPLPEFEQRAARQSHDINQRGIAVDLELAGRAVGFAETEAEELTDRINHLTGGEVTRHTQVARLKKWLGLPNVQKATLEELLDDETVSPEHKLVMEIRLSGAKASTAKFDAAIRTACADGRVRGAFVYGGAQTTMRYSGRILQPHNMPRVTADNPYQVLTDIEAGEVESVYKALSSLLRPMIIAPDGRKLVRCDYSSVEGRVAAWLSDDADALKEYRGEGKLYERAAAAIYKCDVDSVTKTQRQIGKVSELACGYGGGYKAFNAMGRAYGVRVAEDVARDIVSAWRQSRPKIVEAWSDVEQCAIDAYRKKGEPQRCFNSKISMIVDPHNNLWIQFSAGRFTCLPGFRIDMVDSPYGYTEELSYRVGHVTPAKGAKEWPRGYLYGGKLFNFCCQGTARDLLVEGMQSLARYDIVMHVHDEIVIEVDEDKAEQCLADMVEVMSKPPAWAEGLPLDAVGEISERFGK